MNRATLLALLFTATAACSVACSGPVDAGDGPEVSTGAQTTEDLQSLDAAVLMRGLLAAPGSPARANASRYLSARFDDMVDRQFASEKNTEEGRITQRVMHYTFEYLAGSQCAPGERIRVYRGTGRQNVIRRSESERTGGLHVFKPFMSAMKAAFGGYVSNEEAYRRIMDPSTKIPLRVTTRPEDARAMNTRVEQASGLERDAPELDAFRSHVDRSLPNLGFAYLFGFDRHRVDFQTDETTRIGLSFSEIAVEHSQGAAWNTMEGSPFSPLISVTLSNTLPVERSWGPGFITVDVCPERLMFLQHGEYPEEREAYIPLFVLPEEITRIVPHPGDDAAARAAAVREIEGMAPPMNANTKAYSDCMSNGQLLWSQARDKFYDLVASERGRTSATFRADVRRVLEQTCRR